MTVRHHSSTRSLLQLILAVVISSGCYRSHPAVPVEDVSVAWLRRAGGVGDDEGSAVAALPDGRIVVVGSFEDQAVFGEYEAAEARLRSAGRTDAFVALFAPDGSLAWVRQVGGIGDDSAFGAAVNADGRIFVIGTFSVQANVVSPGFPDTVLEAVGGSEVFVAAYDASGALEWVRQGGGGGHDVGWRIAATVDGGVVATGAFDTSAVFGTEELHIEPTEMSGFSMFVVRYGADGTLRWARSVGAGGWYSHAGFNGPAGAVAALADDSVALVGPLQGTAVFGRGEAGETALTSIGATDIFVAHLGADGGLLWVARASGDPDRGAVAALGVAEASEGQIVVTGRYNPTAVFGRGESNETRLQVNALWELFVARYHSDGSLAWVRRDGGEGGGSSSLGRSMVSGVDGQLWVAGQFQNSVTFGLGERVSSRASSRGDFDAFLAGYTPGGKFRWVRTAGGPGRDSAASVTRLSDGSAVVTGVFRQQATFEPADRPQLTSAGGADVFVARYAL